MYYRSDIQGLRAIAVTGVILFHAGIPGIPGGFLGVDIFFAISGFLITGMITERGTKFSLIEFYERRARRILPALYVVAAACIPLAWYRLMPDALENFGQSLVAVVAMANNLLLYRTAGYWDLANDTKPLLHTWSLGVEEQFYVVFPLLLLALSKHVRKHVILAMTILAAISIASCIRYFPTSSTGVFYLPQFRAWELLAGALAYLGRTQWSDKTISRARLVGLASIAASYAFIQPPDGVAAWSLTIIPIFGTCLLLTCDGKQWSPPVLSTRPVQILGAVSYSLYLLHQPAFAFTRAWMTTDPSPLVLMLVAGACVPVALLMYRYVETPLRTDPRLRGPRLWTVVVAMSLPLAAFGLFLHMSHGVPTRIYQAEQAALDGQQIEYNMSVYSLPRSPISTSQQIHGGVLVIGNSYARDMANAFIEGGMVPKPQMLYRDYRPAPCGNFTPAAFEEFDHPEVWIVIITDNVFTPECLPNERRAFAAVGFRNIIYVGPKHFGRHLDAYSRVPQEARASIRAAVPEETIRQNAEVAAKLDPAHYIDALDVLTEGRPGIPLFSKRGLPLSKDGLHFSKEGATFFAQQLLKSRRYQWFTTELRSASIPTPSASGT